MAVSTDDDVIQEFDPENLTRMQEFPCDPDVAPRGGIAARMIVLCATTTACAAAITAARNTSRGWTRTESRMPTPTR